MEELSEKAKRLYEVLHHQPFSEESIRKELEEGDYSAEDMAEAAYELIHMNVAEDYIYDEWPVPWPQEVPTLPSYHLCDVLRILLEHGLDPNDRCGGRLEDSLLSSLRYISNGYIGADAAALLMEHGADPNLPCYDGLNLMDDMNFYVHVDYCELEFWHRVDAMIHYWIVLNGYGARLEDGSLSLTPVGSFDIAGLRNHRDYYYGAMKSQEYPDDFDICIFNRYSRWEVARY